VWRLTPGQSLLSHGWDGEHVLYNDLSGDTHLLTGVACAVLSQLQAAPCTVAALAQSCASNEETIDALLADLELLALVEFLPC